MGIEPVSGLFVLVIGVLTPLLAMRTARMMQRLEAASTNTSFGPADARGAQPRRAPTRGEMFRSAALVQSIMLCFALLTAWHGGWLAELFPPLRPQLAGGLAAAAGLAVMIATVPIRWRTKSPAQQRRLYTMLPHGTREPGRWILLCLMAGIGEEIVYRGVLFGILDWWWGAWWPAALAVAVAFALAHAVQGARTTVIIFIMALGMQGLCRLTGELYHAMALHVLYDLAAIAMIAHYGRAFDAPAAGQDPPIPPDPATPAGSG